MREEFNDRKGDGDEDESQHGGESHAPHDDSTEDASGGSAGTAGSPQRQTADDEGEGGHDDGAEAEAGRIERRVADTLAALVVHFGEFHDEDGVLGGEPD